MASDVQRFKTRVRFHRGVDGGTNADSTGARDGVSGRIASAGEWEFMSNCKIVWIEILKLCTQYGLYSGFIGCFVYILFGSTESITIGPTAIMAIITVIILLLL